MRCIGPLWTVPRTCRLRMVRHEMPFEMIESRGARSGMRDVSRSNEQLVSLVLETPRRLTP